MPTSSAGSIISFSITKRVYRYLYTCCILCILSTFITSCSYSNIFSLAFVVQSSTIHHTVKLPRAPRIHYEYQLYDSKSNPNHSPTEKPKAIQSQGRIGLPTLTQSTSHTINTFLNNLENLYTQASHNIKCPFMRRRVTDLIDNLVMITGFLIIRHKTLLPDNMLFPPTTNAPNINYTYGDNILTSANSFIIHPFNQHDDLFIVPGCKAKGRHVKLNPDGSICKYRHLPIQQIYDIIQNDWSIHNNKGYYITGRLNSTIYRDDCYFDGPDPDMPVRGLRKYLAAASHLFDHKQSSATLLDIQILDPLHHTGKFGHGVILAKWKLNGVLMLPWKPKIKPWTGWTKYHLDQDNLIAYHEEGWDISVMEAFVGTMWPQLGSKIWNTPSTTTISSNL